MVELVRALARTVVAGFYISPWVWLGTLAALLVGAVVQFGHFPTYSNPQPSWLVGFTPVYDAAYLLLVPALLSPLVVGAHLAYRITVHRRPSAFRAPALAAYALGATLSASIIFGDAFGLMGWLMD